MSEPYKNLEEQIEELLALADRRLRLPEESSAVSFRRELLRERQLRSRCAATVAAGGAAPLEYLFRTFGLTDFERHCVYLALAPELDSGFEARYAALQEDHSRLPGLALCLRCFPAPETRRSALLAQWRTRSELLSSFFRGGYLGAEGQSDLTAGLKLDRRIPDFVLDCTAPDPALEGVARLFWPGDGDLAPLVIRGELLERMNTYAAVPDNTPLLFCLRGGTGTGRHTLARHFCRSRDQALLEVDLSAAAQEPERWWQTLRAAFREARIHRAALAFTGTEPLLTAGARGGASPGGESLRRGEWAASLQGMLKKAALAADLAFFLTEAPLPPELSCEPWKPMRLELELPDTAGRIQLWNHELASVPLEKGVSVDTLAAKFALQPAQIAAAARESRRLACWEGGDRLNDEVLHRACRAQLPAGLSGMTSRVNAAYTWEDLILPPEQKNLLQNACAQVEYRHRVYDQWGFGKKVAYGRGLSMLFSGPPGTGKTMAAQVIANRLRLELYKVDLSGVLSKYIGETEKQLGAVFDEVKKSQSILFFDEADALFGKRSETKDSHDRYANVQTSYLLQKMEEYDGIVILASNFLQNFDEAFRRRIKFIIDFTLPDRARREQIWRSVLPPELPRGEDLDFDFLARSLELSGSSIKNIAVAAAFLAAEENAPLSMAHLLLAAQAEQNKTGKNLGKEEFGEYYHQVQIYQKSRLDRRESSCQDQ